MWCWSLTCPCFQHSLKIFQLLEFPGSWRQRSRPSQSQVWEVCGSSTLRPITPSLRGPSTPSSPPSEPAGRRPSAFLVSTTEAMMWSRKLGRLPFILSPWQITENIWVNDDLEHYHLIFNYKVSNVKTYFQLTLLCPSNRQRLSDIFCLVNVLNIQTCMWGN